MQKRRLLQELQLMRRQRRQRQIVRTAHHLQLPTRTRAARVGLIVARIVNRMMQMRMWQK